jgi:serine/threonine protein kinase
MPGNKANQTTSVAGVRAQLEQAANLKKKKTTTNHIFSLAQPYLMTRAKLCRKKKEANDKLGTSIQDISHSVLICENEPYIMLRGNIFYSNSGKAYPHQTLRGRRKGKLAINQEGELFLIKIVEQQASWAKRYQESEAIPEMEFAFKSGIAPHKNIVTRTKITNENSEILEIVKTYSIMRYKGISAADLIKENKLSDLQMLDLAIQFMLRVYDLHALNIVHRDLKPANYVVTINENNSLNVFAVDFGYSKEMRNFIYNKKEKYLYYQHIDDSENCGTLGYYPDCHEEDDENYNANIYDFSTDMYSAAKSALYVLEYLKKSNQSAHKSDLLQKLEELAYSIVVQYGYQYGSTELPKLNKESIKRQLDKYKEQVDNFYPPITKTSSFFSIVHKPTPLVRNPEQSRNKTSKIVPINSENSLLFAANDSIHLDQSSVASKKATPSITPVSEEGDALVIHIKDAFYHAIDAYKKHPQSIWRAAMCFCPEKHKKTNIERANNLRENINQARCLKEIQQAVKICFSDSGIKPFSLISFILEEPIICEALQMPLFTKGFWHTTEAANQRIDAKQHLSELTVEPDLQLLENRLVS